MAMGRREEERQRDLFVIAESIPKSPGHAFYRKLNELLAEAGFDRFVEALCEPHYAAVRGRALQRLRSEYVERTFAHLCETGGARRTWLRSIEKVRKRFSIAAAAHNLCVMMRSLFQMGTPRGLQRGCAALGRRNLGELDRLLQAYAVEKAALNRWGHPSVA